MILRKLVLSELPIMWNILQQAIEQRRLDGSEQWQHGYPNEEIARQDILNGDAYALVENDIIIACVSVIFGIEPAYNVIQGKWLTDGDYATIHRIAILDDAKGRGVATYLFKIIEDLCRNHHVFSIKVDTNFDNARMLRVLEKLDYTYCGEVFFTGAMRNAFEKVLDKV